MSPLTAEKYRQRPRRLLQEHKGLEERALTGSQRPSPPGDALDAGCVDAHRLCRPPLLTASHSSCLLPFPLTEVPGAPNTRAPHGQPYQNTPLKLIAPPADTVEVTDPTHPWYDLTFPLLGITTKPRLGRVCILQLSRQSKLSMRLCGVCGSQYVHQ